MLLCNDECYTDHLKHSSLLSSLKSMKTNIIGILQSIRFCYAKSISFLLLRKKIISKSMNFDDIIVCFLSYLRLYKSKILMLTFFVLIFFSCGSKSSSATKPVIILSEEQMTAILMDVHLVEGTINFKRNIGQGVDEQKSELYNQLMEDHGVTPEILESNLMYYNQKPEVLEKIYEEIITRLSIMQTELKIEKDLE
jgi:hypothetical protein